MSRTDQDPARQIEAVEGVEGTSTDHLPGTSRAPRTALATMLRHVRGGDTVRVASMGRVARSGIDLADGVHRGRARRLDEEAVAEARRSSGEGVPEARIARDPGCSRRVLRDALAGAGPCAVRSPGTVWWVTSSTAGAPTAAPAGAGGVFPGVRGWAARRPGRPGRCRAGR